MSAGESLTVSMGSARIEGFLLSNEAHGSPWASLRLEDLQVTQQVVELGDAAREHTPGAQAHVDFASIAARANS